MSIEENVENIQILIYIYNRVQLKRTLSAIRRSIATLERDAIRN